ARGDEGRPIQAALVVRAFGDGRGPIPADAAPETPAVARAPFRGARGLGDAPRARAGRIARHGGPAPPPSRAGPRARPGAGSGVGAGSSERTADGQVHAGLLRGRLSLPPVHPIRVVAVLLPRAVLDALAEVRVLQTGLLHVEHPVGHLVALQQGDLAGQALHHQGVLGDLHPAGGEDVLRVHRITDEELAVDALLDHGDVVRRV